MKLSDIGVRNHEGSMFEDLPFDLHLHIFSLVDLGGIIALRKTCKLFHSIASQRIIWVDRLRRVCSDNSVFKPTFPIEDMSVIELEQAVFAPTRWLNQVMISDTNAIKSSRRMRTITLESGDPYFHAIYLVPGGRFLIAFSEDDMCVWDLGYSSNTILSNTPIASAPHLYYNVFSVVPTADDLGLRIFSMTMSETNNWADEGMRGEFWIFEIYPLSEKPALSKIASLLMEDDCEGMLFSLHGDLLIYQRANHVKVWNFVTDMGVTFNVGGEPPFGQLRVTAEWIILVRAATVSIWNIPPLVPGGHIGRSGELFVKPSFELAVDFNMCVDSLAFEYGEELQFEIPSDWYTHHPIIYDIIHQSDNFRDVWRYEVILPEGRVKLQNKFIHLKGPDMVIERYRFCNGTLVMFGSNVQSVFASSVLRKPEKMIDFWKDATLFCNETGLEHIEFTLCPAAGRLCQLSPKQDSIIIVDYLALPST